MRSLEEMEAIERIAQALTGTVSESAETCEHCILSGDVEITPSDVETTLDRLGLQLVRVGPLHLGAHPTRP